MQRSGNPAPILSKLLPARPPGCPHLLDRWVLRTSKSTATYPDGNERPMALRGGRLTGMRAACIGGAGHPGAHKTMDGRTWR